MRRCLVTGTGRCGTGYVAAVMQAAGVPWGHEQVYGTGGPGAWQRGGESSWMAAPFLKDFDGEIVHLMRHPLRVLASFLSMRFFSDRLHIGHKKYRLYAEKHCPEAFETSDEMERAMRFVLEWNKKVGAHWCRPLLVEDLGVHEIQGLADFAGSKVSKDRARSALAQIPTTFNTRSTGLVLGWDDLPDCEARERLRMWSGLRGYPDALRKVA